MQIPEFVYFVGGTSVVIALFVIIFFFIQSRRVNLTRPYMPDEKPEWLKAMPPEETMAATLADGEGITLYNYDEGEHLAAPFAEQIEDILQAHIKNDPRLASLKVDFGTNPSGNLGFWVDGTKYDRIEDIPNKSLQAAILQAVNKWQQYMDSQG